MIKIPRKYEQNLVLREILEPFWPLFAFIIYCKKCLEYQETFQSLKFLISASFILGNLETWIVFYAPILICVSLMYFKNSSINH